jgi:hypothetical protein
MQIFCIYFSIKRQKTKLAQLIIGLLPRRKQVGTKKILYEGKTAIFGLSPETDAEPLNIPGYNIRYDGVTDVIKTS